MYHINYILYSYKFTILFLYKQCNILIREPYVSYKFPYMTAYNAYKELAVLHIRKRPFYIYHIYAHIYAHI